MDLTFFDSLNLKNINNLNNSLAANGITKPTKNIEILVSMNLLAILLMH